MDQDHVPLFGMKGLTAHLHDRFSFFDPKQFHVAVVMQRSVDNRGQKTVVGLPGQGKAKGLCFFITVIIDRHVPIITAK